MPRILITGNRGFFGTRFHARFDGEHDVLGIDRDDVDILDRDALERAFRGFRPELVIHAAAITSTEFADAHPDLTRRINIDGAVNVALASRDIAARLVFFSTEQVYNGNQESGPYAEDQRPAPDTMYGKTKREAEDRVREILEAVWVLRFTWLFGLPEYGKPVNPNVLWNAFQIAVRGKRVKVPRHEYRGHTDVYTLLDQILGVLDLPYGIYHTGSRNDLGRYEITCHALREMGLSGRVEELVEPDDEKYAEHPRDIRLATDKLTGAGWRFPESAEAISQCLAKFGLKGAFG